MGIHVGKEREGRHLWQITAIRDILWLLLATILLWLAYQAKNILLPLLIGLTLAYLFNPLITWIKKRWGISRLLSIAIIFALVLLAGGAAGIWLGPLVVNQVETLLERLPGYLQIAGERYGIEIGDITGGLAEQLRSGQEGTSSLFELAGRIVGTTTTILLWMILIPVYFFYFSWHFQGVVEEGQRYLSLDRHPKAVTVLRRMDEAVGTFFRARLVICLILGVVFAVGWWLAEVPYWFLLGIATGLLNIVPYVSVLGWGLALVVKYLDMTVGTGAPGFEWMAVLLWPSVVFAVGNFLEAWVLTPLIHGHTTPLSPIVIFTLVLVGGSIGGFWGLLLAIPVALCLDILAKEFLWKRDRK